MPHKSHLRPEKQALSAGFQIAPKEDAPKPTDPNPYLANLPDAHDANYFAWRKQMAKESKARAKSRALADVQNKTLKSMANEVQRDSASAASVKLPFVHDEEEPKGTRGSNDSHANAEPIKGFGTAAGANPVIAHEIGHTLGNDHTENTNDVANIMDSGGGFHGHNLYGIGNDGLGGTPDDVHPQFVTDGYFYQERIEGLENTLNITAWGYARK